MRLLQGIVMEHGAEIAACEKNLAVCLGEDLPSEKIRTSLFSDRAITAV